MSPVTPLRLGRIDYVNADPFFAATPPPADLRVVPGVPTALNARLLAGELDASWISSVEALRNPDELVLVSPFCIAAPGPVRSVVVVSEVPWDALSGETFALSNHSATSVALLEVLIRAEGGVLRARRWDHRGEPPAGPVLLIGDEALNPPASLAGRPYVYDLAARWRIATGLPMVFGALAARRDFLARPGAPAALSRALGWMAGNLAEFERRPFPSAASARRTAGLDGDAYRDYFAGFCFRWREDTERGFREFHTRAAAAGLVPPSPGPGLYEAGADSVRALG